MGCGGKRIRGDVGKRRKKGLYEFNKDFRKMVHIKKNLKKHTHTHKPLILKKIFAEDETT